MSSPDRLLASASSLTSVARWQTESRVGRGISASPRISWDDQPVSGIIETVPR